MSKSFDQIVQGSIDIKKQSKHIKCGLLIKP